MARDAEPSVGIAASHEEDPVIPKPNDVWELSWEGVTHHYLILEAVDVSKHRWCDRPPEPGFWMLDLRDGQTTYMCCDGEPDDNLWQRLM